MTHNLPENPWGVVYAAPAGNGSLVFDLLDNGGVKWTAYLMEDCHWIILDGAGWTPGTDKCLSITAAVTHWLADRLEGTGDGL